MILQSSGQSRFNVPTVFCISLVHKMSLMVKMIISFPLSGNPFIPSGYENEGQVMSQSIIPLFLYIISIINISFWVPRRSVANTSSPFPFHSIKIRSTHRIMYIRMLCCRNVDYFRLVFIIFMHFLLSLKIDPRPTVFLSWFIGPLRFPKSEKILIVSTFCLFRDTDDQWFSFQIIPVLGV